MLKFTASAATSSILILLLVAGCATSPTSDQGIKSGSGTPASSASNSAGGTAAGSTAASKPAPGAEPPKAAVAPAPAVASSRQEKTKPQFSPSVEKIPEPPQEKIAIFQTRRHDNLVERLRAGFTMPELDSSLVTQHERWIARNPEYLTRVFERGGKYLYHIVEELESRNMPTELALLPIVESAFNPQALSKAKAAGLWQFIPSTGRIYDLKQNWWTDERRDIIESTRAALDYLQKLYEMQDKDWFLALASYNWGENAVNRARRQNQARGLPSSYVDLKMPKETSNYVPRLIALRNVLARPAEFGIRLAEIPNKPFFVAIDKEQSIDLSLAAKFAGMSVREFVELNPSHHRPVINASRTDRIILPADRAESFQRNLQEHIVRGDPLVTWKPYTLKANENLAAVAKIAGVSVQELVNANSLKRNAQLLPGTTILAPVAAQVDEPHIETTLARFSGSKVIEKEWLTPIHHKVTKRDTLSKIAARYGVSPEEIRRLNKIENGIATGQRLVIRTAKAQTVLTDEKGNKTVLAANEVASTASKSKPARATSPTGSGASGPSGASAKGPAPKADAKNTSTKSSAQKEKQPAAKKQQAANGKQKSEPEKK